MGFFNKDKVEEYEREEPLFRYDVYTPTGVISIEEKQNGIKVRGCYKDSFEVWDDTDGQYRTPVVYKGFPYIKTEIGRVKVKYFA